MPIIYLTPDQIEDVESGWFVAVVLDAHDLDVLHSGLTLAYCDADTQRLWSRIEKQIQQTRTLERLAAHIDTIGGDE
jgi:hypothetical protein